MNEISDLSRRRPYRKSRDETRDPKLNLPTDPGIPNRDSIDAKVVGGDGLFGALNATPILGWAARLVRTGLRTILAVYRRRRVQHDSRARLRGLDDRMLRDIGIGRDSIEIGVVEMNFWQSGTGVANNDYPGCRSTR